MRILALGDSYLSADVFRAALAGLEGHDIRLGQLDATRTAEGPGVEGLREFEGDPAQVAAQLGDAEVLLVHGAPVSAEVLDAGGALRLVGCARGGPVNVDLAAASARGIPVVTTPGKNAEAVADLTLALAVMLARGLPVAQRHLLDGGSVGESAFEGARFLGRDLGGLTLGLVGVGQVGRRVATRAAAFGMRVLAHDPYAPPEPGLEAVDRLEDLLAGSDIVSLHARASAETADLLDGQALARLPRGSWVINTARDSMVDEAALLAALQTGQVAGAALDVVRARPDGSRNPLLDDPRVIVLPHIGGATRETLLRGARMLCEEVERFAAGRELRWVANPEALRADRG